jgi:hypothetical protein
LPPRAREISQSYTSGVTLTNSADNLVRVSGTIDTGSGSALTGAAPTAWTIVNQALLRSTDTAGNGITLAAGGTVLNNAGARIAGGQYGVSIAGGAGTVINAGSIAGAEAVQLAAGYANRVMLAPGAAFSGMVNGGNTIGAASASTLELVSGATQEMLSELRRVFTSFYTSYGTLSGIGVNYTGFGLVTVDDGATWVLGGTNSIAAGTTLAIAGRLNESGSLTNAGSIAGERLVIYSNTASAVLSNLAGGVISASGSSAAVTVGTGTFINAGILTPLMQRLSAMRVR